MSKTNKVNATFVERAEKLCRELGAVDKALPTSLGSTLVIETVHGPLTIYPRETAIRTCFDNKPAISPTGPGLNPYSFKWNFEFAAKRTPEEAAADLSYFDRCLRPLLINACNQLQGA